MVLNTIDQTSFPPGAPHALRLELRQEISSQHPILPAAVPELSKEPTLLARPSQRQRLLRAFTHRKLLQKQEVHAESKSCHLPLLTITLFLHPRSSHRPPSPIHIFNHNPPPLLLCWTACYPLLSRLPKRRKRLRMPPLPPEHCFKTPLKWLLR